MTGASGPVKARTGNLSGKFLGRHLVGVWIGGVWNGHLPEPEKYFSEVETLQENP